MGSTTTADLSISVLGPLAVARGEAMVDLGGPKRRATLGMLVANAGKVVSRDRILDGVWGPEEPDAHRGSFHTYVSSLRGLLGEVIERQGDGYRLVVPAGRIDAVAFESEAQAAAKLIAVDPPKAAQRLHRALGMWRGLPYADLVDVPGLQDEIRRLDELRLSAVELRIDADLAAGLRAGLVAETEALAEQHPTRERFRAQHMLALYRSGRQADALRAYRRTEQYLAEELGVDPSRQLRDLELAILQQDDDLLLGGGPTTGRLAFLVTDIDESTGARNRHPQAMDYALAVHDRIIGQVIESYGGRAFKRTIGGFFAAFPDVSSAVAAAESAQRALAAADRGRTVGVGVRMGIDVGEAESRNGDFTGPPVTRAGLLCWVGHGGQVLVSGSTQSDIAASGVAGVQLRQLGEHRLRGLAAPERIAQLVFAGLPDDFPDLRLGAPIPVGGDRFGLALPGYELREPIGEGASGVVYRGYQPSVGREVAIKIIRPDWSNQPSFVRRFEAEARSIARLAHPHIVPLIDYWRDAEGAYLVLQLLEGGSLEAVLEGESVAGFSARRWLNQIGQALDRAHAEGVVHGDLHPGNVLLDNADNAYLSDFAVAARLVAPEGTSAVSSRHARFRAPELAAAGPSPAGDIFSLAVLARQLLDDRPELSDVLARATSTNPQERPPSASALLVELDQALGEPHRDFPRDLDVVIRNPYKGLRAFDESDAADFHGRDQLVSTLIDAVERRRFVTVVGPSGCGKSSVVRAGLLPALADGAIQGSERWLPVVLTPGPSPLDGLLQILGDVASRPFDLVDRLESGGLAGVIEALMADMGGDAVLIVDQFEELFTLVDPARRDEFIHLLVEAVSRKGSRLRVVVTLRADFYDSALKDDTVGRLVRDGQVTVIRPTDHELIEMISIPAHTAGLRFESGLVQRIANDVHDQSGSLPLLQFALTEMVDHRSGSVITQRDYDAIGGVAGALSRRAESVWAGLAPAQQQALHQLFLRLVTVDEDSDYSRRRVRRRELESLGLDPTDVDLVLGSLVNQRLLLADRDPVTREPTVEVTHEALLRTWPRLSDWIDEEREALLHRRRFRAAMNEWNASGCDDDYLLSGARLASFLAWGESFRLTSDEHAFLDRSRATDEARRRRRRRLRRGLTIGSGIAAMLASLLALFALSSRREAIAQRNTAFARELTASAVNAIHDDPELSILLSLQALQVAGNIAEPSLAAVSALHQAVRSSRALSAFPIQPNTTGILPDGALSPDGSLIALAEGDWLEVSSPEGQERWRLQDPGGQFADPQFSPDGSMLAVAVTSASPTDNPNNPAPGVYLLNPHTGKVLNMLAPPTACDWVGLPTRSAFNGNGRLLLALVDPPPCSDDNLKLEVMGLDDLTVVHQFPVNPLRDAGKVWVWADLDLAHDRISISDQSEMFGVTKMVKLSTGETEWQRTGRVGYLSPDGTTVALIQRLITTGSLIELADAGTGTTLRYLPGHSGWIGDLEFSRDGQQLYSAGGDGTARTWDVRTGRELITLSGAGEGLIRVSGDSAGRRLMTIGETQQMVRMWDVSPAPLGEPNAIDLAPAQVPEREVAVAGQHAAVLAGTGTCPEDLRKFGVVLDLGSWKIIDRFEDTAGIGLAFMPDGRTILYQELVKYGPDVSCQDEVVGGLVARDVATGSRIRQFRGLCEWVDLANNGCAQPPARPFAEGLFSISTSADGRLVAGGGASDAISVWDSNGGEPKITFGPFPEEPFVLGSISPGGTAVAVALPLKDLTRVFSVDGKVLADLPQPGPQRPVFSRDGSVVAVGGRSLAVFDTANWARRWMVSEPHDGDVVDLDVSPSGNWVVTTGRDGYVRLWSTDDGSLLQVVPLGDDWAGSVAFIDDEHVLVATQHGLVAALTFDVNELVDIARSRLTRGLTDSECRTYLHTDHCPQGAAQAEATGQATTP